jgi:hypothetical protein
MGFRFNCADMKSFQFVALIAMTCFLDSCSGPELTPTLNESSAARKSSQYAEPPHDRPGLGTKWGETRISHVASAAFERASKQPVAFAAIYYDNAAGIRAMAGAVEWRSGWPSLRNPAGN